jgi:hypothetical protein
MTHHTWVPKVRVLALVDVIVGAADAHAPDPNRNFARSAVGLGSLFKEERARLSTH